MTDTFPFKTRPPSGGGTLRVKSSQFGDGYAQEVIDGLNADMQKWSAICGGYETEMRAVVDWIRDHQGQSFYWTPPLSDQILVKCNDYKPQEIGRRYYTVTLEFEQTFQP